MIAYFYSTLWGSYSPVHELGSAIQKTFVANTGEPSKIFELLRTIAKVREFEGKVPNGLRGQFEEAKVINALGYMQRVQNLGALSTHSYEVMKAIEDEKITAENTSFDEAFEFIRKNFDLIAKVQALFTQNGEASNAELQTLLKNAGQDVSNVVFDLVLLNLATIKKETLDPDYYKTAEELGTEFVLIDK
jgi:hypothetical protein